MCASEVQALLDHNILPHYTKEVLGGKDPSEVPDTWEQACHAHAVRLGLEEHSSRVHFPFSISLDNARVHTQSLKTLMMPRVTPAEEATMLHEMTKKVLGVTHLGTLAAMLKQAFTDSRCDLVKAQADALARQPELRRLIGPLGRGSPAAVKALMSAGPTAEHCKRLLDNHDKFDAIIKRAPHKDDALAEFFAVCAIGRQANGMEEVLQLLQSDEQCFARDAANRILKRLEDSMMAQSQSGEFLTLRSARMRARRVLACHLPQWRCLLPQQLMPLAVATPDLHAPAEVGVRTVKAPVRELLESTPLSSPSLLLASTYQRFIQRRMDERRLKHKDIHAARRCIDKLRCTARIIAAEAGAKLHNIRYTWDLRAKNYVPPEQQKLQEHVYGTGGGWVGDARFN